jgi:hypothetical protein
MDNTVLLAAAYVKRNALPPNSPKDAFDEAVKVAAMVQLCITKLKPPQNVIIGLQVAWVFCGYDEMRQPGIESLLDHPNARMNILENSSAWAEQRFRDFCVVNEFEDSKAIEAVVGFIRASESPSLNLDDPVTWLIHCLQDARQLTPIILQKPPELLKMIGSRRWVDDQSAAEIMEGFLNTIDPKTSDWEFFFTARKKVCYRL